MYSPVAVDDIFVFSKSINVDYKYLYGIARRKASDIGHFIAVITVKIDSISIITQNEEEKGATLKLRSAGGLIDVDTYTFSKKVICVEKDLLL